MCPASGPLACVVIDAAEQLPTFLLASLIACSDASREAGSGANVAWLLITQLAPESGVFQTGSREMPALETLCFDGYTRQTLARVGTLGI